MELSSSAKLNIHLSLPKQNEMFALRPSSKGDALSHFSVTSAPLWFDFPLAVRKS